MEAASLLQHLPPPHPTNPDFIPDWVVTLYPRQTRTLLPLPVRSISTHFRALVVFPRLQAPTGIVPKFVYVVLRCRAGH